MVTPAENHHFWVLRGRKKVIDGMHTYTPDELRTHLTAAGFRDIAVHTDDQHHWLCVTAKK